MVACATLEVELKFPILCTPYFVNQGAEAVTGAIDLSFLGMKRIKVPTHFTFDIYRL